MIFILYTYIQPRVYKQLYYRMQSNIITLLIISAAVCLLYLCTLRFYLYRNSKGKLQSLIVNQMLCAMNDLKFIYKIEVL